MRREVRGSGRRRVTLEVRRRRAANDVRIGDATTDQRLAADRADSNREVERLVDKVDRTLGELDLEAELPVLQPEVGDR